MMTKTEMDAALARLSRYIQARIDASPVYPQHLADMLNDVQRAKEGEPAALLAAARLWDSIRSIPAGRQALDAA
jgi:hypothetical protein